MKQITLSDFLTQRDLTLCIKLYQSTPVGFQAQKIAKEMISPNIETINKKLGQDNDPLFLAYAVIYCIEQSLSVTDAERIYIIERSKQAIK